MTPRARCLIDMVLHHKFSHGAEIGAADGETTAHLLRACPGLQLTAVDAWADLDNAHQSKAVDIYNGWDHVEKKALFEQRTRPYQDRLQVLRTTSQLAAYGFPLNSLDFVFIDADHSFVGVSEDIISWAPRIRPGGIICGHDIDWPGVQQAVEKLIPDYRWANEKAAKIWWGHKEEVIA